MASTGYDGFSMVGGGSAIGTAPMKNYYQQQQQQMASSHYVQKGASGVGMTNQQLLMQ